MKLIRRIDYWLNRRKYDAELAEEMEFHRAQSGPEQWGNSTLAREDARAVWIWPWLESIVQDLRYALRNLRRQPGFAMIAFLSLGAAIGIDTSVFTVFDAVALRPWPVRNPGRLTKILTQPQGNSRMEGLSLAEYRYLNESAKSLDGVAAMDQERVRLGYEAFGKTSWATFTSANYFQVLGVAMIRGRGFLPEEDHAESPENVAVLSYASWRDHFGSDTAIVGKPIHVDDVSFTVVGVAGEEFTGTSGSDEDLWIPLPALQSIRPNDAGVRQYLRGASLCCTPVAARLAPGVSRSQALSEIEVLDRAFRAEFKLNPARVVLTDATILAGHSKRNNLTAAFTLMFAAVTLVLLLACANVSNLLIARAAARQHEIEVRRAVGAGRARIMRQLLTEGLVLALGASIPGIALASKLPAFVFALVGEGPNVSIKPDAGVIAYAVALAALACVAFALAPALHGTRPNAGSSRLPMRGVLLTAQVAMSVVLLIGAGLMIAGIRHAREQDPGFRIAGVSVISFELPASSYSPERTRAFSAQLSRDLDRIPGLRPIGIAMPEPLSRTHWSTSFRLPGEPADKQGYIESVQVSPGYFDVLGVPILAGRNLGAGDESRPVAIVNEAMARRHFDGANPVGKSIVAGGESIEIVGMARDAYLTALDAVGPLLFRPLTGAVVPKVLLRANDPGALDLAAGIAKQIDGRTRTQILPLSANLDEQLAGSRAMAEVAGMLGAFALALALIGMSGVFGYAVQQRRKEIGIRMALGASPKQVIMLVLAGTARSAMLGLALGLSATAAGARIMAAYLYGVSAYAPVAYLSVALLLVLSGLLAAYLPARRAIEVDPLIALRVE